MRPSISTVTILWLGHQINLDVMLMELFDFWKW